MLCIHTVKPPNKGHSGDNNINLVTHILLSFVERLSSFKVLNVHAFIGKVTFGSRAVSFVERSIIPHVSLVWKLHDLRFNFMLYQNALNTG